MTDSRDSLSPAKDVRALFDKASIGNFRYRTCSKPKVLGKNETIADTLVRVPETAQPPISAPAQSNMRRALETAFDMNNKIRTATAQPGLSVGVKAALAFASCAGSVGKTTLCATIARILSARLPHLFVADRSAEGILPLFFGLERLNAGGLQTAYPNARRPGYPMTLVAAPHLAQSIPASAVWFEKLRSESSLTLLDLPVFPGPATPEALNQGGVAVVVLAPDVQSVASLARAEELAAVLTGGEEARGRTVFVLNRFDETRALHREIRAQLERLLGDRLAPVVLRESELVPEALSLGMTVLDHAPESAVAREFQQLAGWLETRLANSLREEKIDIA